MTKHLSDSNKIKMLPSHEVYHRIIWDKRLNPSAFTIGYSDRLATKGMREKPLTNWEANGEIPWHRIRYIRCGTIVVWDRDQHIDFFSTEQLPEDAWQNNFSSKIESATTSIFSSQQVYYSDLLGWRAYHQGQENVFITELKIISFNVLADMYEAEKIYTETRIPFIIDYLQKSQAEVIVLQEVTQALFQELLKQPWLKGYFCSEAPEAPTLQPQSIVIFSKFPFTLTEHWYSVYKRALVATWQINDQAFHLAAVHLTSSHTNNSAKVRANQLDILLKYLASLSGDVVIAGDFNFIGDEHLQDFEQYNFKDIWQKLRPKELGYTFNPEINSLAKITSSQGRSSRFDRILLRSKTDHWQAQKIEMFGCEAIPNTDGKLFISDHFGLSAILQKTNPLEKIAPIYHSAIVIIPPKELWPAIQSIRKLYDKKVDRWMPHITLIYGFVPEKYFKEASELISNSLKQLTPFTITLSEFNTFTHRSSSTAWLKPIVNPSKALHELQATLQKLFPQCNEQSHKANGFTPHLSVGQFDSPTIAMKKLPTWQPLEFTVDSIALISRRGDKPFEVKYLIPIGQSNGQPTGHSGQTSQNSSNNWTNELALLLEEFSPSLTQKQKLHREAVLSIVKQACSECLAQTASLHLIGSARLGVENQSSDLDIVCIIPNKITGQEFLSGVKEKLTGIYQQARIVSGSQVPILKLVIEDISIDLLYAQSSQFPFLQALTPNVRTLFDQTSWQTLVGSLEGDILLETSSRYVQLDNFRQFLRFVRIWAKARAIIGNAWGFPGNFSWALMAAWSCENLTNKNTSPALMLVNFFERLSQHNWSEPIALTQSGKNYQVTLPKDLLPIITSVKPHQNSARNICHSTAELIKREIARGAKLLTAAEKGQATLGELFEKAEPKNERLLTLTVKTKNTNSLELSTGWIEGHIFGLMINLEQQLNAKLRPWPLVKKQQTTGQVMLSIDIPKEKESKELVAVMNAFTSQFYNNVPLLVNNSPIDISWGID